MEATRDVTPMCATYAMRRHHGNLRHGFIRKPHPPAVDHRSFMVNFSPPSTRTTSPGVEPAERPAPLHTRRPFLHRPILGTQNATVATGPGHADARPQPVAGDRRNLVGQIIGQSSPPFDAARSARGRRR